MTPYIIGLGLAILVQIVAIVWKFATMNAEVDDTKDDLSNVSARIYEIENDIRHFPGSMIKITALEQSTIEMRKDIKSIDGKLNNIIGKLDM